MLVLVLVLALECMLVLAFECVLVLVLVLLHRTVVNGAAVIPHTTLAMVMVRGPPDLEEEDFADFALDVDLDFPAS